MVPPVIDNVGCVPTRLIPLPAPFFEMLEKVIVPPTLLRSSAVPVVVVIELSLTLTPVMPPEPVMLVAVVVASERPCSFDVDASVIVPLRVVVPAFVAGRAVVPLGGLIPKSVSNAVVDACPITHSSLLSV